MCRFGRSQEETTRGRKMGYRPEMHAKSNNESDVLSILTQYLELLEFHTYVFEKTLDITEADVVVKLWSSLIERLFRRSNVRTKWGELMGDTNMKVDVRFLKYTLSRKKKAEDMANSEVAKTGAGHIKTMLDESKMLVESKVILDHFIKENPGQVDDIVVPALQLIGKGQLYIPSSL